MRRLLADPVVRLKFVLWVVCLAPLGRLLWFFYSDMTRGTLLLTANPIEFITRSTGTWTLVWLLATLCVSPLRGRLNWPPLIRVRRLLGLFAFFYACLHLSTYLWLDQFFNWPGIVKDIAKRPFITVGFSAWLLLLPLALTSTQWAMRKLGRRWQKLHRLAYVAPTLGVLHYWWLVKADVRDPLAYGLVLLLLLAWRVRRWKQKQRPAALSPTPRRATASPPA